LTNAYLSLIIEASDKEMAPQVLEHPGTRTTERLGGKTVDVVRIPAAGDPFSAKRRRRRVKGESVHKERKLLTIGDLGRMLPELVRRVQARADLAPLLEFDRDVYERSPVSGGWYVARTERVRLLAGEDGDSEIYHVPAEGEQGGEA
jgi:hypothetical protein